MPAPAGSGVVVSSIQIARKTLRSYGGQKMATRWCAPDSLPVLQQALALASQQGWKVVFRAGGRSFDTHSLNETLVIDLGRLPGFRAIDVDGAARTVRVGAGATWGAILRATLAQGLVPAVMVTSSHATAGGTLSADCLSRFSPTYGKEGTHVRSFEFLKLDGSTITCSRAQNHDVFQAVIGGLGCLGLVLAITHDLVPLKHGKQSAVLTRFVPFRGLRGLADSLVGRAAAVRRTVARARATGRVDPVQPRAISAALYMNRARQGLLMRSHYVQGGSRRLHSTVLHRPNSPVHALLQIMSLFEWSRRIGWWVTMNLAFRKPRTYVDRLHGYTFFQDGNERIKHLGRTLGLPMGLRQQTYVIPWDPQDRAASAKRLARFLEAADRLLDRRKLLPTLIDVLYVPDESQEGFLLSSSTGMSGFAVSIAFEKAFSARFPKEERALYDISRLCHALAGRVHVVKHVFADPGAMQVRYRGLGRMIAHKNALDPDRLLQSEFLRRVFPALG